MARTCPVCGKENLEEAKFCFSCGASLTGEAQPTLVSSPVAPPQTLLPVKEPRRRWNWRCCGSGCLLILLVVLIGLPVLHVTVVRPFL